MRNIIRWLPWGLAVLALPGCGDQNQTAGRWPNVPIAHDTSCPGGYRLVTVRNTAIPVCGESR